MAFGGTMGAAGALIPFALIYNIKGEQGAGYDANGRLKFTTADGVVYTPERVDTLLIGLQSTEASNPLDAVIAGGDDITHADCGELVTSAPAANQNGLPTNFGPGRGNWNLFTTAGGPFSITRVRVDYEPKITAALPSQAPPNTGGVGQGSVMTTDIEPIGSADVGVITRNFFGVNLDKLVMTVECLHSIQG